MFWSDSIWYLNTNDKRIQSKESDKTVIFIYKVAQVQNRFAA